MNTSVLGECEPEPAEETAYGAATSRLPVGTCIQGKYVVSGVLGCGGFAVVYDAEHIGLGRQVAIKVLHLTADTPHEHLERFRREARISALAKHRNVLEVYDTGTLADGSPYLVMERVNGSNLSTVLERGRLPLAAVVEVARQLLAALCALADVGIVHRDIKPDNIMLHDPGDGQWVVKLVDFGISKRTSIEPQPKLTCHGTLIGTPQYMSPEQIRGQEVDARADLYAAGAVMYEALGGHAPHESQNFCDLMVAVLSAPLRPLHELRPNCPAALERIATKALARSPEQRYASPRDMLADLEACARELELPLGRPAFEQEDPTTPAWMTPARASIPALNRWWQRTMSEVPRPLQLAAALVLLAAPSAALGAYLSASDALTAAAGSAVLHGTEPPVRPSRPREPSVSAASAVQVAEAPPANEKVPPLLTSLQASDARAAQAPRPRAALKLPARAQAVKEPQRKQQTAQLEPAPTRAAADPALRARWEHAMARALANLVRGQFEAAKSYYQSATRIDGREPDAFRGLALVCAQLGHAADARGALHHYLTLAPHAPDAASLRARIQSLPN